MLLFLAVIFFIAHHRTGANRTRLNPVATATNVPIAASGAAHPAVTPATASAPNPDFQKRPYPVSYESPQMQWTSADGLDTNVIRQLAHNPLEYDRMVRENPRLLKRQLVYLKETAAAVFEKAKLTHASVQELTLPGMDGQEFQFEIVQSDSNGSSRHGMFSGHLAGNLQSMVTMAFQDGREAFTVISPQENIFIEGEPREPGQVIVKAFDPNTYGTGPQGGGDDFIKTQPANN